MIQQPRRTDALRARLARIATAPRYARVALQALGKLGEARRVLRGREKPAALVYFGQSPGDDLLCTPVLRALHEEGRGPLWMMSDFPDIFTGNPHVAHVVPFDDALARALSAHGVRRMRIRYHDYLTHEDRSVAPPDHIITLLARNAGVRRHVELAPEMYLTESELNAGQLFPRQVAIQSTGMTAGKGIITKEWFPERFQEVVDSFRERVQFVQLGLATDTPLMGAHDLRGRTTIRESAAIIAGSLAFVGLVGFQMHLARAVRTPAVIVYGGRELPTQSGYAENLNLFSPVPCAPCWQWFHCDYGHRCMHAIGSIDVAQALERVLAARTAGQLH